MKYHKSFFIVFNKKREKLKIKHYKCNKLLLQNIIIKRYEMYNHIKQQQRKAKYDCTIEGGFGGGLIDAFYDLMNYVSVNNEFNTSI